MQFPRTGGAMSVPVHLRWLGEEAPGVSEPAASLWFPKQNADPEVALL